MATEEIEISKTVWTRITDLGESGTCWKKTGGTILVDHTTGSSAETLPTASALVTIAKSKRVPLDNDDDNNVLGIPADSSSDVFYAIAHNSDDSNKLVIDVI